MAYCGAKGHHVPIMKHLVSTQHHQIQREGREDKKRSSTNEHQVLLEVLFIPLVDENYYHFPKCPPCIVVNVPWADRFKEEPLHHKGGQTVPILLSHARK